jgi:hypothetical protein
VDVEVQHNQQAAGLLRAYSDPEICCAGEGAGGEGARWVAVAVGDPSTAIISAAMIRAATFGETNSGTVNLTAAVAQSFTNAVEAVAVVAVVVAMVLAVVKAVGAGEAKFEAPAPIFSLASASAMLMRTTDLAVAIGLDRRMTRVIRGAVALGLQILALRQGKAEHETGSRRRRECRP